MMATRLCRIPITAFVSGLQKPSVLKPFQTNFPRIQLYANEARTASRRATQRKSFKEMAMAPAGTGCMHTLKIKVYRTNSMDRISKTTSFQF